MTATSKETYYDTKRKILKIIGQSWANFLQKKKIIIIIVNGIKYIVKWEKKLKERLVNSASP